MSKPSRRPRAAAPPPAPAPRLRTNRVLVAGLVVYLTILATMVAFDSYTFVLKSAVIPVLLLVAIASRRFSGFVNDWAVFLGVVVLLDSSRSVAYAAITHFQLPMYADYAIRWERLLCAGAIAPLSAQEWRAGLAAPLWLDRFFVLMHASHFLVFLLFGFVLWTLQRSAFRTYAVAMTALLAVALLIQFLVPTIPPWLAARDFLLLPPIERLINGLYNTHLPSLAAMFDINPIAAMPSLHTAMPALCALFALWYLGGPGLVVCAYAVGVWVAVIYLGEHYLVDVVAGLLLALAIFEVARRWGAAPRRGETPEPVGPPAQVAPLPIVAALLLIAAAFACGQLASHWLAPLPITRAFVERELVGRSPTASFFLGRIDYEAGDFPAAQAHLNRALGELRHPTDQVVIRTLLGQSAWRSGDYGAVVGALEPVRTTTVRVDDLVLLARAYVEGDRYEDGVAVLRDAGRRFPADPEPLYWLTRVQFQRRQIDRAGVDASIASLGRLGSPKAAPLQKDLSAMLAR